MYDKKVIGICPCCGGDVVEKEKNYGCVNWRECGFTIWKESYSHRITEEEAIRLTDGEEIGPFDLISRAGKAYRASLYWDDAENKIKLKFPPRD